jgi:tellurite resistance protein
LLDFIPRFDYNWVMENKKITEITEITDPRTLAIRVLNAAYAAATSDGEIIAARLAFSKATGVDIYYLRS